MIEKSWLQIHKQCVLDLHFLLPVHKPVHINGVLYMYTLCFNCLLLDKHFFICIICRLNPLSYNVATMQASACMNYPITVSIL